MTALPRQTRLGRPVTPSDARVGYRRTGNASRSFLCLATSVGRYPADSGIEGSPGRDRASGLAQFWNGLPRATTPFVMAAIDLNASSGGGLNMLGDCPGKTRQFSSDRGRDHGG
jgi:hypothetical protein